MTDLNHSPQTAPKKRPRGLKSTGKRLWNDVMDNFELTDPEAVLLREACRTADSIDGLQAQLDADGLMSTTSQGVRVHPALAELRQQRVTLARLWAALRVPIGEDTTTPRTQARGIRGVYSGNVA